MNVLITGTSKGIGKSTAELFLSKGYEVFGLDILAQTLTDSKYHHYMSNVGDERTLPDLPEMSIVINNAGTQGSDKDITTNLIGTMNVTKKYALDNPSIVSVVNVASASAHTGAEFAEYSASKGGVLTYTKHVALQIAKYGATCNSISPGGVLTELNKPVIEDPTLWDNIMKLTPLRRWATSDEIAEWIYFMAVNNKFMTGQDVLIDGGESTDAKFIWRDGSL